MAVDLNRCEDAMTSLQVWVEEVEVSHHEIALSWDFTMTGFSSCCEITPNFNHIFPAVKYLSCPITIPLIKVRIESVE
jgi:hypothetical protein